MFKREILTIKGTENRIINYQTDMGIYFMWDLFFTHLQDLGKKIKEDRKMDKESKQRGGSGTKQKNTAAPKGYSSELQITFPTVQLGIENNL